MMNNQSRREHRARWTGREHIHDRLQIKSVPSPRFKGGNWEPGCHFETMAATVPGRGSGEGG